MSVEMECIGGRQEENEQKKETRKQSDEGDHLFHQKADSKSRLICSSEPNSFVSTGYRGRCIIAWIRSYLGIGLLITLNINKIVGRRIISLSWERS